MQPLSYLEKETSSLMDNAKGGTIEWKENGRTYAITAPVKSVTVSSKILKDSSKARIFRLGQNYPRLLPDDVMQLIFNHLDVHSLHNAQKVCKHWYNEASERMVWAKITLSVFPGEINRNPIERINAYIYARINEINMNYSMMSVIINDYKMNRAIQNIKALLNFQV